MLKSLLKSAIYANHDFMKLWIGQGFSMFGSLIGKIAMPLLVIYTLYATPTQVAWVRVSELLPGIVLGLFAGVWIDRLQRKRLMIVSDILRLVLVGSIPAVFFLGHVTLGLIMIVASVVSVVTVLFDSALDAYLPTVVNANQAVEANGKLSATGSVAEVAGFGISGALFGWLGGALTLSVDAATFAISAITLIGIRKPEPQQPRDLSKPEPVWTELRGGMSILKRNRSLTLLVYLSGIQNMYYGISGTVYMLFISRILHIAPGIQGVLYGVGGIASFFTANLTGRLFERRGFGKTMIGCAAFGIVGAAFLPAAFGPEWLVILFLLAQQLIGDGADTVFEVGVAGYRQTQTPNAFLGRVHSIWRVVTWTCMLVGTVLGGVMGETVGVRDTLFLAIGLRVAGLIVTVMSKLRQVGIIEEVGENE